MRQHLGAPASCIAGQSLHLIDWAMGGRQGAVLRPVFRSSTPDFEVLRDRWRTLLEAQPGLRVLYRVGQDSFEYAVADAQEVAGEQQMEVIEERDQAEWVRERSKSVEPSVAPLRAAAIRTDGQWSLILLIHHALVDDWSLGLIAGAVRGLKTPTIAVSDFHSKIESLRRESEGLYAGALPTWMADKDGPWDTVRTGLLEARASCSADTGPRIPATSAFALRAMARQDKVTISAAMLAIIGAALRRIGLGDQHLLAMPVTLRDVVGFDAIGPFMNIVNVPIRATTYTPSRESVQAAQRAIVRSHPGRGLNRWEMAAATGLPRSEAMLSPTMLGLVTVSCHLERPASYVNVDTVPEGITVHAHVTESLELRILSRGDSGIRAVAQSLAAELAALLTELVDALDVVREGAQVDLLVAHSYGEDGS